MTMRLLLIWLILNELVVIVSTFRRKRNNAATLDGLGGR